MIHKQRRIFKEIETVMKEESISLEEALPKIQANLESNLEGDEQLSDVSEENGLREKSPNEEWSEAFVNASVKSIRGFVGLLIAFLFLYSRGFLLSPTLFTVKSEYQTDLAKLQLPEGLRQEFKNKDISLSQDVIIEGSKLNSNDVIAFLLKKQRSEWHIEDKGNNQTFEAVFETVPSFVETGQKDKEGNKFFVKKEYLEIYRFNLTYFNLFVKPVLGSVLIFFIFLFGQPLYSKVREKTEPFRKNIR
jgi:hypothetical protein